MTLEKPTRGEPVRERESLLLASGKNQTLIFAQKSGRIRPALIAVRLHLIAVWSSTEIEVCMASLNAVRSGTEIKAELLLVLAHFSRRK